MKPLKRMMVALLALLPLFIVGGMLLAVVVGLSVIIPYIGATVVTFPVLLVGWFQWGWGGEFITLTVAYLVIQALDGNVLVPLLFGEVVSLHPIAIIVAILVFGGLWGFWGVFFAIPLATLVNAIMRAWPARHGAWGSGRPARCRSRSRPGTCCLTTPRTGSLQRR